MSDTVQAQVILQSRDGTSILDAEGPITSENVEDYQVEQEVVSEAQSALQSLGFSVVDASETTLTIEGPKPLFERVFRTTLERKSTSAMRQPDREGDLVYYEAASPPELPDVLSSLVADITFPQPPQFHV